MSTASRVRKSSPIKQGPMRATIPMSSLLRQNTNTATTSPDHTNTNINNCFYTTNTNTNSGQRSPGSGSISQLYKAKCKTDNKIRRTASLDTIYLKGQWPRDTFYFHCGLLQVDKATQTEETTSSIEEKCFYRQRNTIKKASPVNIPIPIIKPIPMIKPPMRNSIEGLNQEIERLVLKGSSPKLRTGGSSTNNSNNSMEKEDLEELDLHLNLNVTPEGHRAPLADLLRSNSTKRSRSVNTQTPAETFQKFINSAKSASTSTSDSNSSPDDDQLYNYSSSASSSTRFFSTSPHINRFLAREPPDGCERVNLRFYEDTAATNTLLLNPPNVNVTFQLKPSLGSAFQPLKIHHNTDIDIDTNVTVSESSNCINNAQSPG